MIIVKEKEIKKAKALEINPKNKLAEIAAEEIRKRFGEGSIMKLGEARKMNVEAIPTGSISLDIALGIGGVPKGRVIEIYGPESSGKTTLALHIVSEAQKRGGLAAFIDAEHALDPEYAKKIGVKVNDLFISQPDNGEQALEIADALVRSNSIDVIVVDSVAALTPKAEIEGEMGDSHMGLQARLMSQALRKLTGTISKTNTTVIFINQLRMKIGVMFGNPETTTGGNALKFYASVRIDVRRKEQIKEGDRVIGNHTIAKIVKNKVAPPFQIAEFDIIYNQGISRLSDLIVTGVKYGVVQKSGTWFSFDGQKMGQGMEASKKYLEANPKIAPEIQKQIKAKIAIAAK